MEAGRQPVESELDRLGAMIGHEGRAEDQMMLTILHGLATVITYQAKELKEHSASQQAQFEVHQKRINEHEKIVIKGETSWRWITIILSGLSICFLSLFSYGYFLIADIRDSVKAQQAIDDYINKTQTNAVVEGNTKIIEQSSNLGNIQLEIERIKKLKAVKGSK